FEKARYVQRVAAHADDHVVANHQRSRCGEVLLFHVCQRYLPPDFSAVPIERDEVIIGRLEEEPIAVDTYAPIADVDAAGGLPFEVPQLLPGTRVQRPHMVRHREIEDAVDHE